MSRLDETLKLLGSTGYREAREILDTAVSGESRKSSISCVRSNEKRLSTHYCQADPPCDPCMCANSKLSQQRDSPHQTVPKIISGLPRLP
jgi:hypothetical protein